MAKKNKNKKKKRTNNETTTSNTNTNSTDPIGEPTNPSAILIDQVESSREQDWDVLHSNYMAQLAKRVATKISRDGQVLGPSSDTGVIKVNQVYAQGQVSDTGAPKSPRVDAQVQTKEQEQEVTLREALVSCGVSPDVFALWDALGDGVPVTNIVEFIRGGVRDRVSTCATKKSAAISEQINSKKEKVAKFEDLLASADGTTQREQIMEIIRPIKEELGPLEVRDKELSTAMQNAGVELPTVVPPPANNTYASCAKKAASRQHVQQPAQQPSQQPVQQPLDSALKDVVGKLRRNHTAERIQTMVEKEAANHFLAAGLTNSDSFRYTGTKICCTAYNPIKNNRGEGYLDCKYGIECINEHNPNFTKNGRQAQLTYKKDACRCVSSDWRTTCVFDANGYVIHDGHHGFTDIDQFYRELARVTKLLDGEGREQFGEALYFMM